MPSVDCGYDGGPFELVQTGPRLSVQIGFDPEYRSGGVAEISSELLLALIDTGADDCCIDVELATGLKLPKVADRRALCGVVAALNFVHPLRAALRLHASPSRAKGRLGFPLFALRRGTRAKHAGGCTVGAGRVGRCAVLLLR